MSLATRRITVRRSTMRASFAISGSSRTLITRSICVRSCSVGAPAHSCPPAAVPAAALLDDLRGTAADFDELRLAILDEARTLPSAPDPARLGTLKALDALVTTIDGAEADRARRAAWEAARDDALSALDRVM